MPSSLYCMMEERGGGVLVPLYEVTTHDLLLQMKDIVVEELVQLFIGVVDTQLLKGVVLQEVSNSTHLTNEG